MAKPVMTRTNTILQVVLVLVLVANLNYFSSRNPGDINESVKIYYFFTDF